MRRSIAVLALDDFDMLEAFQAMLQLLELGHEAEGGIHLCNPWAFQGISQWVKSILDSQVHLSSLRALINSNRPNHFFFRPGWSKRVSIKALPRRAGSLGKAIEKQESVVLKDETLGISGPWFWCNQKQLSPYSSQAGWLSPWCWRPCFFRCALRWIWTCQSCCIFSWNRTFAERKLHSLKSIEHETKLFLASMFFLVICSPPFCIVTSQGAWIRMQSMESTEATDLNTFSLERWEVNVQVDEISMGFSAVVTPAQCLATFERNQCWNACGRKLETSHLDLYTYLANLCLWRYCWACANELWQPRSRHQLLLFPVHLFSSPFSHQMSQASDLASNTTEKQRRQASVQHVSLRLAQQCISCRKDVRRPCVPRIPQPTHGRDVDVGMRHLNLRLLFPRRGCTFHIGCRKPKPAATSVILLPFDVCALVFCQAQSFVDQDSHFHTRGGVAHRSSTRSKLRLRHDRDRPIGPISTTTCQTLGRGSWQCAGGSHHLELGKVRAGPWIFLFELKRWVCRMFPQDKLQNCAIV